MSVSEGTVKDFKVLVVRLGYEEEKLGTSDTVILETALNSRGVL